jgi:hypothetical protein
LFHHAFGTELWRIYIPQLMKEVKSWSSEEESEERMAQGEGHSVAERLESLGNSVSSKVLRPRADYLLVSALKPDDDNHTRGHLGSFHDFREFVRFGTFVGSCLTHTRSWSRFWDLPVIRASMFCLTNGRWPNEVTRPHAAACVHPNCTRILALIVVLLLAVQNV